MTVHRFIIYWQAKSLVIILIVAVAAIIFLGLINYLAGYQISFSLFYTLPIAFVTWFVGRRTGLVFALVCAAVWQAVNVLSGEVFTHSAIPFWNAATRFGFFTIIVYLLSGIHRMVEQEKNLSRTDFLTGSVNSRAFYEVADYEIKRFRRYNRPFTIVYIDLDNFKMVNDRFGHSTGDDLLQLVARILRANLRVNDTISRLGGDEFALLLPETDQASAKAVVQKAISALLQSMQENNWPVTFSVGVITCRDVPDTVDMLVEFSDRLMYEVKTTTKNDIKYRIFDETRERNGSQ